MSANVEPEEDQAIRNVLEAGGKRGAEVLERDFKTPRRLSATALEEIRRAIQSALTAIEDQLSELIGVKCPLELASIGETTADGLFSGSEGPFAAVRFAVGGQPAWVVWDNLAALQVVEKVLGSTVAVSQSRRLSSVESAVLESLLACIADGTLRALDLESPGVEVAQSREALGDWRASGVDADPHRLHLELALDGSGEPSTINVYVPVSPRQVAAKASAREKVVLPPHLQNVEIDASVRLRGCDVSLDELLALEVGDVIPLDGRVGDLAQICVDGRVLGHGVLGARDGHIAVRIEQLQIEEQDSQ